METWAHGTCELYSVVQEVVLVVVPRAFLSGGAAFIRASSQIDRYEASVMIQIDLVPELPNPDSGDISTSTSLAKTYVVLAKSYDVLEATVEALISTSHHSFCGLLLTSV
jgi:capsular polysaccharide biosynthesis protein